MSVGREFKKGVSNQKGAVAVLVGIAIFSLVAFSALAIDLGHLYVVKNELQNAADAGALAAADVLILNTGTEDNPVLVINTNANEVGANTAMANKSEKLAVEVTANTDNSGDVQRGHWNPVTKEFNPSASTDVVNIALFTTAELNANSDYINAVKLTAKRKDTPATSFFARIFGYKNFGLDASAVAYIGFAGTLEPLTADQPIGICKQFIWNPTTGITCSVGRMINSGSGTTSETGGWTNFVQPCTTGSSSVNAGDLKPLICGGGNPEMITLGQNIGASNGEIQTAFDKLITCWKNNTSLDVSGPTGIPDGIPDKPWRITLPVFDCSSGVEPCTPVVGAVTVDVVWITRNDKNQFNEVPRYFSIPDNPDTDADESQEWTCSSTGEACWNEFRQKFNLKDQNNNAASYEDKALYFLPNCNPHVPAGGTGGENYGIYAERPVLVEFIDKVIS